MYEGALRIPMLVHLPEMRQARESGTLVTLMDLAGASYDPSDLDTKSFADLLKGEEQSPHEVQQSELMNTIMLFDGRYKWIRSFTTAASCTTCRQTLMSCTRR